VRQLSQFYLISIWQVFISSTDSRKNSLYLIRFISTKPFALPPFQHGRRISQQRKQFAKIKSSCGRNLHARACWKLMSLTHIFLLSACNDETHGSIMNLLHYLECAAKSVNYWEAHSPIRAAPQPAGRLYTKWRCVMQITEQPVRKIQFHGNKVLGVFAEERGLKCASCAH